MGDINGKQTVWGSQNPSPYLFSHCGCSCCLFWVNVRSWELKTHQEQTKDYETLMYDRANLFHCLIHSEHCLKQDLNHHCTFSLKSWLLYCYVLFFASLLMMSASSITVGCCQHSIIIKRFVTVCSFRHWIVVEHIQDDNRLYQTHSW